MAYPTNNDPFYNAGSPHPSSPPPLNRSIPSRLPPVPEDYDVSVPLSITLLLRYSSEPKVGFDVHFDTSTIISLPHRRQLTHHELTEPATNPPLQHMCIVCPVFKQPILVSSSSPVGVTTRDVFAEVHRFLNYNACAAEFNALPSQDAQYRVNSTYLRRTAGNENERWAGMKRVDFLTGRSRFLGLSKMGREPYTFVLNFY
jgi:hypothetical protein